VTARSLKGKNTFSGGVHPPEWKQPGGGRAIEVLPAPGSVHVPLLQHLGAPCEMTVEPKTEVALDDVIGDSEAYVSAPVHACVRGVVGRASVATLPNGRHVAAVPIQVSGEQPLEGRALFDDVYGGEWPIDGVERFEPHRIVDACRAAGLVGMGGAAFPTHVKIARNEKRPIHTVLINGCECEPYLTADDRLMVEAPAAIVMGTLLAGRAVGARELRIYVEDNTPAALEALRGAAAGTGIEVGTVKTKYPQGGEKQLILAALGKEVPTGGLPLDIGIVVMNVGTAAALARAVLRGKPLTHRVITVSGGGIRNRKNLLVPIGVRYRDMIDACGGLTEDAARVVAGGPMMGFTLGDLDAPVTKGTSGVVVLTHKEIRRTEETACVRCGRCVEVCPLRLVPTKIALASKAGDLDLAERYHLTACMECGCCAYVCPAGVPLVQLIRLGKVVKQKRGK